MPALKTIHLVLGRAFVFLGVLFIFSGIIMNMRIYFQPTSLFDTLIMLVLLVGGVGLIARSLRSFRLPE